MSNASVPETPRTRSERRLAARAAVKASGRSRRPAPRRRFSPLLIITALVLLIGVGLVSFTLLSAKHNTVAITPPTFVTPIALATGRTLGPATAKVTIDVWADFQCPSCELFTTQVEPGLVNNYLTKGQVRLVFHDMAFLGQESTDAAIAARAADAQGKFWPFHDYLYANQGLHENSGAFSRDRLVAIATAVGLDVAKFQTALADPTLAAAVAADLRTGQAAGVTSTPTIFINGKAMTTYDLTTLSSAIDAILGTSVASPAASAAATP